MNRINTAPPISSPRNRCGLDHRSVKRPRDIRGALVLVMSLPVPVNRSILVFSGELTC